MEAKFQVGLQWNMIVDNPVIIMTMQKLYLPINIWSRQSDLRDICTDLISLLLIQVNHGKPAL